MTKTVKSKFKLGQMVWYIADGYIANYPIKAIFEDRWGEVVYSTDTPDMSEGKYRISVDGAITEPNLFASKDALIKSIKDKKSDE